MYEYFIQDTTPMSVHEGDLMGVWPAFGFVGCVVVGWNGLCKTKHGLEVDSGGSGEGACLISEVGGGGA